LSVGIVGPGIDLSAIEGPLTLRDYFELGLQLLVVPFLLPIVLDQMAAIQKEAEKCQSEPLDP